MLPFPSPVTRALRAFTALITVWCLGCSSFEPLLAELLGSAAGPEMVCASEGGTRGAMSPGASSASSDVSTVSVGTSEEATSARGFTCDCQGCYAPSPALPAVALDALPALGQPHTEPAMPLSIEREPLVPPPQSGRQGRSAPVRIVSSDDGVATE
jgi:hypothetical protein